MQVTNPTRLHLCAMNLSFAKFLELIFDSTNDFKQYIWFFAVPSSPYARYVNANTQMPMPILKMGMQVHNAKVQMQMQTRSQMQMQMQTQMQMQMHKCKCNCISSTTFNLMTLPSWVMDGRYSRAQKANCFCFAGIFGSVDSSSAKLLPVAPMTV